MVGLIRRVTKNFQLQIPTYDGTGWGFALNKNFDLIDSLIFSITGISDVQGEWLNNTSYAVGDRVIDPDTGGIYQANVTHVSASVGTFAQDRAANPTRWTILLSPFAFRGAWATGIEYRLNEFLYSNHRYGVATTTFTSGASYDADVAAGKIITLADLTASVNAAAASATAAAGSATAANNSAIAAAASAAAAATFDPANFVGIANTQTITGTKTFRTAQTVFAAASGSTGLEIGQMAAAASAYLDFHTSGNSNDYDARIIASGGAAGAGLGTLTIHGSVVLPANLTVGTATYQTDGNIVFSGGMTANGASLNAALGAKANLSGATYTGDIAVPNLYATAGQITIDSASNRHLWFRTNTGVVRGLLYHDNAGVGAMTVGLYNAAGANLHNYVFASDGLMSWSGNGIIMNIDKSTSDVYQMFHTTTAMAYRWYYDTGGTVTLQRSNDNFVSNIVNYVQFPAASAGATFVGAVTVPSLTVSSAFGNNSFSTGTGDGATLATYNIRIAGWNGIGFPYLGDGINRFTIDTRTGSTLQAGNAIIGGATFQTDGNILFAGGMLGYGAALHNALDAKAPLVPAFAAVGTYISANRVATGGAGGPNIVRTGAELNYWGAGVNVGSGSWRAHGIDDDTTVCAWLRIA